MSDLVVRLFNLIVILFLAILLAASKVDDLSRNIIHSLEKSRLDVFQLTDPKDNPYSVLVVGEEEFLPLILCSGTLLSETLVLTTSHCTVSNGTELKTFLIYAGGKSWQETTFPDNTLPTGAQIRGSKKVSLLSEGDLALIYVNFAFRVTEGVKPIQISEEPWVDNEVRKCIVTGFGVANIRGSNPELDYVRKSQILQTVSPCKCHDSFGPQIRSQNKKYFSCSLPKPDYGLCVGDSGAGLICNDRLQGVSLLVAKAKHIDTCDFSFDIRKPDFNCGDKNTVTVFTLVYPYASWIKGIKTVKTPSAKPQPITRDGAKTITESSHVILLAISISLINSC